MGKLKETYQYIAHILDFKYPNSDLEIVLSQPTFNWDAIVIEGSKHLVLPAIYCRLKTRNLSHCVPSDLFTYLEHLTTINRNRNFKLLNQIKTLSQLLNEHHISYVFLKGSALLAMDIYEDFAERMVGDIDILIESGQLQLAFNTIKDSGYSETTGYAYQTINFRHLDRLINPNQLAAVELHNQLFNAKKQHLIPAKEVLLNKRKVNGIYVPDRHSLTNHLILGSQVNDLHFFYDSISFKTTYDYLILSKYIVPDSVTHKMTTKYHKAFFSINRLYFKNTQLTKDKGNSLYYRTLHKLSFGTYLLGRIIRGFKFVLLNAKQRLNLLIFNPFYRKHLIKKIFSYKLA